MVNHAKGDAMKKSDLIGKKGSAEVIEIFAVAESFEAVDAGDCSYHATKREAIRASRDVGWGHSKVEPRLAVRFEDGTMLLLAPQPEGFGHFPNTPEANVPMVELSKRKRRRPKPEEDDD